MIGCQHPNLHTFGGGEEGGVGFNTKIVGLCKPRMAIRTLLEFAGPTDLNGLALPQLRRSKKGVNASGSRQAAQVKSG